MAQSITRSIHVERLRQNIIRILQEVPGFMRERELLQKIPRSYYPRAKNEISLMLSQGILVRTGLGTKGSPHALGLGLQATNGNCPCCGQALPTGTILKY